MSDEEYRTFVARLDEHYDGRYRRIDACDERHKQIDEKLMDILDKIGIIKETVAVQVTKTGVSNKILSIIATAAISGAVTLLITLLVRIL